MARLSDLPLTHILEYRHSDLQHNKFPSFVSSIDPGESTVGTPEISQSLVDKFVTADMHHTKATHISVIPFTEKRERDTRFRLAHTFYEIFPL